MVKPYVSVRMCVICTISSAVYFIVRRLRILWSRSSGVPFEAQTSLVLVTGQKLHILRLVVQVKVEAIS
jgi:hypothetical protein